MTMSRCVEFVEDNVVHHSMGKHSVLSSQTSPKKREEKKNKTVGSYGTHDDYLSRMMESPESLHKSPNSSIIYQEFVRLSE